MLTLCLVIHRGMRVTPLGFCLRVIVNEKPLNLEKTTSSVLSVLLLIYTPTPLQKVEYLPRQKTFFVQFLYKYRNS